MAFTTDDFNKIWASTSPLTPYEFSDSNYQQGWNFIGATPPARQMWDFLQKRNDEKAQWLYNNKLSLSGGTMTGSIVLNGNSLLAYRNVTDSWLVLFGGTNENAGAFVSLYGKDSTTNPGCFILKSTDGTNSKYLVGSPDGSLTWDGSELNRIYSQGSGYIRYANGMQLCHYTALVPANTTDGRKVFSYPVPFVSVTNIQASSYGIIDGKLSGFVSVINKSNTQVQIQVATATNTVPTYDVYVYVFVVGTWK